jgi:uracil-DNA glycosylase
MPDAARRPTLASPRPQFGHGILVAPGDGLPWLMGCYHPSRQNTNTGKLTARMMEDVFREAHRLIQRSSLLDAPAGPRSSR